MAARKRGRSVKAKVAPKKVRAKTKAAPKKVKIIDPVFACCRDHNSRTCIRVTEENGEVKFIPMAVEDSFEVHTTSIESFYQRFEVIADYPVERGCQLFLNYSRAIGATEEVLNHLKKVINIPKEEYDMATAKAKARKAAPKKTRAKATTKKTAAKAKTKAAHKKAPVKKGKTGKFPSAAAMFQALIRAGKKTDDQIFTEVQKEFGLDEKKRGYVAWYRNYLTKKGEKVPVAKK